MANAMNTRFFLIIVIACVVLVTAGCAKNDPFFPEASNDRPATDMVDAQIAAAAARSGNLYNSHFDDAELNALGRQQLDAIARGTAPSDPVIVRFAAGTGQDLSVRRMQAVAGYLMEKGLPDERIVFADRFDDSMYSPAAVGLANLPKTNTGSADGGGAETPQQYGTSMDLPN